EAEVLAAIAGEVAEALGARLVRICRWEPDGSVTVASEWGEGPDLARLAEDVRAQGPVRGGDAAAAPVAAAGEAWGHVAVAMPPGLPLPAGVEEHLADVAEVVAGAIAGDATRRELAWLADEQAALR